MFCTRIGLFFVILLSVGVFVPQAQAEGFSRRTFIAPPPSQNGKVKIAFFDADGTLRVSKSGGPSANGANDFIILPFVPDKIHELVANGYLVAIVSNQAGIPRMVTFAGAEGALSNMVGELKKLDATVHYFDFAEDRGPDRKPGAGMAQRLEKLLASLDSRLMVDWANSIMVGDAAYIKGETRPDGFEGYNFTNTDRLFAENLKIRFIEAAEFFGWNKFGSRELDTHQRLEEFLARNPGLKDRLAYCANLLMKP
ncbi:MAG: HAD-IIIA family hydrolase [Deltaproteobacteria bacterium]|nr:HAD-IIIA family hydrolase [Deltaproteobacteria bacterium]